MKSGVCVSCRISKPGGKRGKVGFGVFHASHGAAFPPRFYLAVLGAPRRRRCVCAARVRSSPALWGCWPKSDPPPKSCARMAQDQGSDAPSTRGIFLFSAQAFFPPRSLRIDSPCISMRWALCTSRSRMLSAKVGSPICSCHLATGSWLVKMVERV